ncbi:hypothetical protein [Chryseobacterium culicis]|jgi:hypothetical protein|uniref:Peptidoglycan-binding protein LysM n=1 Tax=Chryseobacterium culicis TaxID=680127 RepID=A0A1H6H6E1_CHRCI|nr:hypothetical protein [Chryseobacterium culicis]MBE4947986.1 hypothetical protein [Chryseobacterium culicis]SEH29620.1 hypothetical protein SAMN05421593_1117 [Chryseobacterium culicis]
MKNLILASFALLGFATLKAQNVTLNVRLKPIQTLVVNNAQKTVNLDYVTKDDYANGVTSVNADHLSIYSTGGFQVKVKSANAALQSGGKNIQSNTIQIKASAGSEAVNGAQYAQNVQLSPNETTLVSSSNGGVDKKINIEYKGAGANTYLDNYIAGQDPTVYTTELTYTIISQ